MDIYLLDSNYVRTRVIDEYESFIWTVRYSAFGDFKLVVHPKLRATLSVGKFLSQSESDRIMRIEQSLETENDAGEKRVEITGRSMESVFDTRVLSPNREDYIWAWKAHVGLVISRMVETTCIAGSALIAADVIPELYRNYAPDTTEEVDVAVKAGSLYERVKEVADSSDLGFRIQLLETSPKLRFNIFKGDDRPEVVFSRSLDNLTDTSRLVSNLEYKNIAYVWGQEGKRIIVPAPGVSVNISGTSRRVMHVDAGDIDPMDHTMAQYDAELKQRGLDALSKQKRIDLLDGKISDPDPLASIQSARIGDIVRLLDNRGGLEKVRISEYIWTHDAEGLRSFLTFSSLDAVT